MGDHGSNACSIRGWWCWLTVSEVQLDELSLAITEFWKRIPLEVCFSQVNTLPKWFAKDFANG